MQTHSDQLLGNTDMLKFFSDSDFGLWRSNFAKEQVTILPHQLLGLNSCTISFSDFNEHLTFSPDGITSDNANGRFETCMAYFSVEAKKLPVCFATISKITNSCGEKEHIGYFKIISDGLEENFEVSRHRNFDIVQKMGKISQSMLNFIKGRDLDYNVNSVLSDIIEQYDVDRVYVFEYSNDEKSLSCIYEKVGKNISAEIDNLQNIPVENVPWWNRMLTTNSTIIVSSLDDLPDAARNEYTMLQEQGVKSLLVMPIFSRNQISGFFGIDMVRYHVKWSPEDLGWFSTIVNVFSVLFELRKSEVDRIRANDRALELERVKLAMLANISHEIRTPLNAIVGFAGLLTDEAASRLISSEDKAEFLKIINTNSDLLLQLVKDILDMSKIEVGSMGISYSKVHVEALCEEIVQSFRNRIEPNTIEFVSDFPKGEVELECDRSRLIQVLNNLLGNALKFTPSGSITLGYRVEEGCVYFYVKDTGKGIAKEDQEKIFENFVQVNSHIRGTGLGLAICKKVVNQMNGSIGVDSEEGKGSTFWFRLPLSRHEECGEGQKIDALEQDHHNTDLRIEKPMVLVAEDDESNFLLISSILSDRYIIDWAHNGVEAVELCRQKSPNLILMDIKMPQLDGIEATKIIRRTNLQVPIIAITAYAYDSYRIKALEAGCNDFIFKPIHPIDFSARIEAFFK